MMGTSTRNSYQATYVEVRFSSTDLAQKIRVIDKVIHRRKSSGQLAITVNAKFRVDGDGTFISHRPNFISFAAIGFALALADHVNYTSS